MSRIISSLSLLILLIVDIQAASAYDLYLSRHYEKQADSKDPELTALGIERSGELAILLNSAGIKQVFSTDYKRTQMTAIPTAERLKLGVTSYNPRELEKFAQQLLSAKQNSLVIGHSNTTPMLVHLLGGQAQSIDESEYGDLFKISINDDEVNTQVIQVPPIKNRSTSALKVKSINSHTAKLRMLFNGKEVGFSSHEYIVEGGNVRATEYTSIPAMKIDATIDISYDATSLMMKKMLMTGTMGAPVDIKVKGSEGIVSGYSSMARQAFKPQGKITLDRKLAPHTYERTTVLMNMPHLEYSSSPQTINWLNAYDNEVKKITIRKIDEKEITVPAGTYMTDVVEVVGGAPSQLYYLDVSSSAVVKIEIPGMPWVYEKIE